LKEINLTISYACHRKNDEDLLLYVFVLHLHLLRSVAPSNIARQLSLHSAVYINTQVNNIME